MLGATLAPTENVTPAKFGNLIGTGRGMSKAFAMSQLAARTDFPVMIQGETGVGKSQLARALHDTSKRSSGRFQAINTSAIPPELIESELFGHRRGSFTGAFEDRLGLLEATTGGTAFLDEIGDMPLATQSHLLHVLDEGKVRRIGDVVHRRINVRIICATHCNLVEMLKQGRFREDLYYRICVLFIHIPPLRDHPKDIPLLVRQFLTEIKSEVELTEPAMKRLQNYRWPGNARELRNVIHRATVLAEGDIITPELLQL